MEELMRAAEWSDRFFNGDWAPDLSIENYQDDNASDFIVREAAREFIRLHPKCPYSENWLVKDFLRRF